MTKQNLWCSMACSSTLFEFLHKNFANHYIVFILKYSTEHNRHSISLCLNIPSKTLIG
ncbi:hypothetical protein C0J52_13216 [Blattella germanica]|nr:hypothetical protein C0J52_13216 [Blattella germanica]